MAGKKEAPKISKEPKQYPREHWCTCTCWHCDIGAHERCASGECHMPKWKDIKKAKD